MLGFLRSRPFAVDSALAVGVFGLLLAAMSAQLGGPGDRAPDAGAVLLLAALAALTPARRRAPVLVLVATAAGLLGYHALAYPPVGLGLPLALPLYTVAERGRWRVGALVAGAIYVLSYAYRLLDGQDPRFLLGVDLPMTLALTAGAIALGDAARTRRRLRDEQDRRMAAVRGEQREATLRQVQAERVRLAREVHDVLAHTVSVVSLHADVVEESVADDPDQARRSVHAIREATDTALRDLRATVHALRERQESTGVASAPAPVGGLAGLPDLLDAARSTGLDVRAELALTGPVGAAVEGTVYRVVQESLTNVLRHSGATRVEVRVGRDVGDGPAGTPGSIRIEVLDDGRGPRASAGPSGPDGPSGTEGPEQRGVVTGHGILGMRERVDLLDGRLDAGAAPGGGFRVRAEFPG